MIPRANQRAPCSNEAISSQSDVRILNYICEGGMLPVNQRVGALCGNSNPATVDTH